MPLPVAVPGELRNRPLSMPRTSPISPLRPAQPSSRSFQSSSRPPLPIPLPPPPRCPNLTSAQPLPQFVAATTHNSPKRRPAALFALTARNPPVTVAGQELAGRPSSSPPVCSLQRHAQVLKKGQRSLPAQRPAQAHDLWRFWSHQRTGLPQHLRLPMALHATSIHAAPSAGSVPSLPGLRPCGSLVLVELTLVGVGIVAFLPIRRMVPAHDFCTFQKAFTQ